MSSAPDHAPDQRRFQPNVAECAAKVIDGEAVIVNLLNGTYYSLDRAGSTIYELLASGRTVDDAANSVARRYDVHATTAQADVARLADELAANRVLVEARVPSREWPDDVAAETREPYATPALTMYDDMADLLALDPPIPRLEDAAWVDTPNR